MCLKKIFSEVSTVSFLKLSLQELKFYSIFLKLIFKQYIQYNCFFYFIAHYAKPFSYTIQLQLLYHKIDLEIYIDNFILSLKKGNSIDNVNPHSIRIRKHSRPARPMALPEWQTTTLLSDLRCRTILASAHANTFML